MTRKLATAGSPCGPSAVPPVGGTAVAEAPCALSLTAVVMIVPVAGVSQTGADLACTTWPESFLSWNFIGMV